MFLPCADDPNETTDQTGCTGGGYLSDNAIEYYHHVIPNLEELNTIQNSSAFPIKIELYLGTLYVGGISRTEY